MFADAFLAFLATAIVLTMVPGLDTAIVMRSSAAHGARHGAFTACGIASGCMCWGTAAAFGLGEVLAAWPLAFEAVRWAGAGYLAWLGASLILYPRRAFAGQGDETTQPGTAFGSVARGYMTNILNPKVGLFYLTLLPQFVPAGAQADHALRFVLAHVAIALVWFVLLAMLTGGIRPWLRRPTTVTGLDRATGGIFFLLGLQLTLRVA
jgi:threonine/homoserine/homoserine lactone efflux protein